MNYLLSNCRRAVQPHSHQVLLVVLLAWPLTAPTSWAGAPDAPQAPVSKLSHVPLFFVENQGQLNTLPFPASEVVAFEQGNGHLTLLRPEGLTVLFMDRGVRPDPGETIIHPLEFALALNQAPELAIEWVEIRWVTSGSTPTPQLEQPLKTQLHYFDGKDAQRTAAAFAQVRYPQVSPGLDLLVYGNQQLLEYDWIVHPGADPRLAEIEILGARTVRITSEGHLEIELPSGRSFRQHRPFVYQLSGERRAVVDGEFQLRREGSRPRYGFHIGPYDPTRDLIIDPILDFSSYLGGFQDDISNDVALDLLGGIYLTGLTISTNFPVQFPFQPTHAGGGQDVFVVKLAGNGSGIEYATYIGGSGLDIGFSIDVNRLGEALVAGVTTSANFPLAGGFQPQFGGALDAFVLHLSATGDQLLWSSYLGGSGVDLALGVAFEPLGGVTVVGQTQSSNFPVAQPIQGSLGGGFDAFVTRVAPGGSTLQFSTFLGGSGNDDARAVTWSKAGTVFVVGVTDSADFPTVAPFQAQYRGNQDSFLVRLGPANHTLLSATYLGGSGADLAYGVAVDDSERPSVAGATNSPDFPVFRALRPNLAGGWDAFLTRFQSTVQALAHSTYLGGTAFDAAYGVGVDRSGNAYLAGYTSSNDLPLMAPIQGEFGGGTDAFLARISHGGTQLEFSTYLGGIGQDYGKALAVCYCGLVFVAGETDSPDLPTQNPIYGALAGGLDGFGSRYMDPGAIFCDDFEIGATTRWGVTTPGS